MTTGAVSYDKKINYLFDSQARFTNTRIKYEETFEEIGFGYHYGKQLGFWLGHREVQFVDRGATKVQLEYRIWQSIVWQAINKEHFIFVTTTRLEQRDLPTKPRWNWRMRQTQSFKFPDTIKNKYTPVFSNEIRFGLNVPQHAVTEDRIFAALQIPIKMGKDTSILIGYLGQMEFTSPKTLIDHNIYLSLFIRADVDEGYRGVLVD